MFPRPHVRSYAAAFLMDASAAAAFAAFPFLIFRQMHGDAAMSGIISAFYQATYAATTLAASRFVSRSANGLRWAYCGAAIFGVFIALFPVAPGPALLCVIAMVSMAGMSVFWPAAWAWIGAEPDPAVRGRRIALYNISWSCGLAVGPLFGGPLYEIAYWLPFLVGGVFSFMALGLVWSLPHEKTMMADNGTSETHAPDRRTEAHLHYTWCAVVTGNAFLGAMYYIFPERVEFLAARHSITLLPFCLNVGSGLATFGAAILFAVLASVSSSARAGVFFWMGWDIRWKYHFGVLAGIQAAAALAFAALGITHSLLVMAFACALVGAVAATSFFAGVTYSLDNPQLKHRRASINEGMVGGGGFLGSIAFGLLAHYFGITRAFFVMPAAVGASILLQAVLYQRGKRKLRQN